MSQLFSFGNFRSTKAMESAGQDIRSRRRPGARFAAGLRAASLIAWLALDPAMNRYHQWKFEHGTTDQRLNAEASFIRRGFRSIPYRAQHLGNADPEIGAFSADPRCCRLFRTNGAATSRAKPARSMRNTRTVENCPARSNTPMWKRVCRTGNGSSGCTGTASAQPIRPTSWKRPADWFETAQATRRF